MTLTVSLLALYTLLNQYLFRLQRTGLGITRVLGGGLATFGLRQALTPTWAGGLGWLKTLVLAPLTGFMVWSTWGWSALAGFALYVFFLTAFVDVISPFPSYRHCFRVIEGS